MKKKPLPKISLSVQIDGEIEAPLSKDTHPSKIGLNRKVNDLHGIYDYSATLYRPVILP